MAHLAMKPGILDKIREGRAIASDADMARLIGVSPEVYGRVKREEQAPSAHFIAALAAALTMPLDALAEARPDDGPSTYRRNQAA